MHRVTALSALGLAAALVEAAAAEGKKDLVPTTETPLVGVVNVERLNVRKGPGTGFPRLGQLNRGDEVVVRHAEGEWYEVDYSEALPVWINEKYVSVQGDAGAASLEAPVKGAVTRSGVRLRNRPSVRGVVLGERQKDDDLQVGGSFNGWYRVVPPADMRCYLHSEYVDLTEPIDTGEPDEPKVEDVLPLDLDPYEARSEITTLLGEGDGAASPEADGGQERAGQAGPAMEKVDLAAGILSGAPPLAEAERALRLLEEALAAREPGVRERVRDVLGRLEPGAWLSLLEKARLEREKDLEEVSGRYGEKIRTARRDLESGEPVDYTARGLLLAPVPGTGRHRLMHGGSLLYELQPEVDGADLSPFVGKDVGVLGGLRAADRAGEAPWILVSYVEEAGL
jgi:hypothetical protein